MTLKSIMEKLKIALSSALPVLLGVLYYFMLSWKTVQSFTDSLLRRLFNVDSKLLTSQGDDLMSFSSGTVLVIILLLLVGISYKHNQENTSVKIKNGPGVVIYLLLTLHIQSLIYWILIILRSRTNISALTYLH